MPLGRFMSYQGGELMLIQAEADAPIAIDGSLSTPASISLFGGLAGACQGPVGETS